MTAGQDWIVHILPRSDWEEAQAAGEYRAASLNSEGFIHYSRPEQVMWAANRFYRDAPDLVLLWIDPHRMTAPLRWETVGDQTFPHGYGALNLEAVIRVTELERDEEGLFRPSQHIG